MLQLLAAVAAGLAGVVADIVGSCHHPRRGRDGYKITSFRIRMCHLYIRHWLQAGLRSMIRSVARPTATPSEINL